jgi:hypothetical protein
MSNKGETLLKLKGQIDQANKKKAELKGQIKEQLSGLKKNFDCSSVDEGDKKLDKLKLTQEKKQAKLDKGVIALNEKMEGANADRF